MRTNKVSMTAAGKLRVAQANYLDQERKLPTKYVCGFCGEEFNPTSTPESVLKFSRRYTDKTKMAKEINGIVPHYATTKEFTQPGKKSITIICDKWDCCAKIMNANEDLLTLAGGSADKR